MSKTKVEFEVFLSSPSDVLQERDDAQVVIDEINASGEFDDLWHLKLYRWDNPHIVTPMPVTEIPQKSVDIYMTMPSKCDLVVVIFWSRMGSPLKMDGREYLSGTHYEYSEALQGYEQHGEPSVWLYRCSQEPIISLKDPQREEKSNQFDLVETFFRQFQDAQGHFTGGVNHYPTHADFKTMFKSQLQVHLRYLRNNPKPKPIEITEKSKVDVPYKGLRALTQADAPIFFGRTLETLEILSRIEDNRLVPILGASGSGKSSLVMAGILPRLVKQGWRIIQCVPSDMPFYHLAHAILTQLPEARYLPNESDLAKQLRQSPHAIVDVLSQLLPNARILLFIDQFEELFTLAENHDKEATKQFIEAIRYPAPNITTVFTMRADFYDEALSHLDELQKNLYGLKKPSQIALYEMITRPAEEAGLILDAGLAETIITEIGDESGALALVAYVLEALYLMAKARHDNHMTFTDYRTLGGVRGAINTLANEVYRNLMIDDAVKDHLLHKVFFELIAITQDESGELIPTRQRAKLDKFPVGSAERDLINHFAHKRLLVSESKTVEVAHEAILYHWESLEAWLTAIKGDIAIYREFERDAKTWENRAGNAPLPTHETLQYFYRALESLNLSWDTLAEPLKTYTIPETTRLIEELNDITITQHRHYLIGDRLTVIGDPRTGIGLLPNGLPDIQWLPIETGGQVVIEKHDGVDKREDIEFSVSPFYVAKYLLTYAQYQVFEDDPDGYDNPKWWTQFPDVYRPQEKVPPLVQQNNYPRILSWYQAMAYTRWLDAQYRKNRLFESLLGIASNEWYIRLPTEWEWQWMAQGGDEKRTYPWGEWDDDHARANTTEAGINDRATAIGMYPHGVAKCGALDVCGNMWEWCINDYKIPQITNGFNNEEPKVIRGVSFYEQYDPGGKTNFRNAYPPYNLDSDCGCRLFIARIYPDE